MSLILYTREFINLHLVNGVVIQEMEDQPYTRMKQHDAKSYRFVRLHYKNGVPFCFILGPMITVYISIQLMSSFP